VRGHSAAPSDAGARPPCGPSATALSEQRYRCILEAEVRRLVNELSMGGPLSRAVLAERCHGGRWGGATFNEAVRAGVCEGSLRKLPFDFIDVPRSKPSGATVPQSPSRPPR
jgi:hypothetical protein